MTTSILNILLFLIFILLSGIHFYWLLGGKWGLKKVIPTKNDTIESISIPKFATLIVAFILVLFGFMYLMKLNFFLFSFPNTIMNYGYWIIPFLFILRAIGEFNYVGFFKKIRNTEFAKADSIIFSPLCLGIGIIGLLIQILE